MPLQAARTVGAQPDSPNGQFRYKLREVRGTVKDKHARLTCIHESLDNNLYSMLSASACQLASMMFLDTPTVPHLSF